MAIYLKVVEALKYVNKEFLFQREVKQENIPPLMHFFFPEFSVLSFV